LAKALQREPGFAQLQFRAHQIYFIYDFAQRKGDQELSISKLSKVFECRTDHVKTALANGLEESKVCNLDLAFDEDSEKQILKWNEA
jgi:hypothetical protein